MRTHRLVATVGVVALSLTTAACHSKSASSAASTTGASSAAAPSTTVAAIPASSAAVAAPTSAAAASAPPASAQAPSSADANSTAASAPAGSGAVTFSGDYSGKLTSIVCVGSGPTTTASFNAAFTGESGTFPGNISSTEFGFQGPADTDFDSGFLNNALDTDGKGFVLDGIVAKDEGGKSVTMHGTLVCP
jgi:hypothetical protein